MPMTDIQANAAALVADPIKYELRVYTSFTDQANYTRVAAPLGMQADQSGNTDILTFTRTADAAHGRLWMDKDGSFHFDGDAHASALIFFDVLKQLCDANRGG